MASAIPQTTALRAWDDPKAVTAGAAVKELIEHEGFPYLLEALESRVEQIRLDLMYRAPSDVAAEYAARAGEMKGVSSIEGIVQGIIDNGRRAETRLKAQEDASSNG